MKKRIRLFVDAHVFDNEFQGSRTFIREIYNILSSNDELDIYLGAYDLENLSKYFDDKKVRFLQYRNRSSFGRLWRDIPAIIRAHQIDFAHFQYIIPLKKECRFIVTTHDVLFNEYPREFGLLSRNIKNFFYRLGARKADVLTTVSEYSRRSIIKYLQASPQKVQVIPNAVNDIFFQPYNKQVSKNYVLKKYGIGRFILCVSRFEPRKNHHQLLRAYIDLKLHEQGVQLVLIGSKTMAVPDFDRLLGGLSPSISHSIFMYEQVDEKNLLEFYRAAEVFVYPSKAEGFGIPPLEAAAARIPVICSGDSAMKDFDFFADCVFDPSDYAALKQKLTTVCSSKTDQLQLETIAMAIRQKYSWEKSAKMLHQLIQNAYLGI